MPLALLALAISAFGIGTTEFVMMGLLPDVADDLHTSIPTAGYLVSGYALGVVIGAPLLAAITTRMPRKALLLSLMGLFTVGNTLSALAPGFGWLLAGRVLSGLPHGAFFGVGAVVAAGMVDPARKARAVSLMIAGLTVANIVGVPAATLLGQHLGWRATFLTVGVIGLVAIAGIALLVPRIPLAPGGGLRRELSAFRSGQVWLTLSTTIFGFAAVFAVYSYVTPMLTEVAGFGEGSVTLVLALFGVGATIGNLLGGRLADRALRPALLGGLGALAIVLLLFTVTLHARWSAALTVVLLGVAAFAAGSPMMMLVMEKARHAPALASAANQAAFNLANAGGAWLGGVVLAHGLGYTAPAVAGAGLAVIGVGIATAGGLWERRAARGSGAASSSSRVVVASDAVVRSAERVG
ncbi:MFS transporter [Actinacidiphila glaucinigra]|uniref:MFS transporter, DHA1 family, inner membrane transport protein n=1 Tax=Actinacidiphila glaucinigra TaxID=235986 RepID=A0A238ZLI1_9ACTN|nr:MFS transporter [Actinacidiphila glaucinigra]SNR83533.1 MFS transporter, DHA1 family, inner membrane transport protein [Actinacidiphila glaucinigra]